MWGKINVNPRFQKQFVNYFRGALDQNPWDLPQQLQANPKSLPRIDVASQWSHTVDVRLQSFVGFVPMDEKHLMQNILVLPSKHLKDLQSSMLPGSPSNQSKNCRLRLQELHFQCRFRARVKLDEANLNEKQKPMPWLGLSYCDYADRSRWTWACCGFGESQLRVPGKSPRALHGGGFHRRWKFPHGSQQRKHWDCSWPVAPPAQLKIPMGVLHVFPPSKRMLECWKKKTHIFWQMLKQWNLRGDITKGRVRNQWTML